MNSGDWEAYYPSKEPVWGGKGEDAKAREDGNEWGVGRKKIETRESRGKKMSFHFWRTGALLRGRKKARRRGAAQRSKNHGNCVGREPWMSIS